MENNIPTYLQSSTDSTQVSTTFTGLLKMIGGVIVLFAVWKGADPSLITSQVGSVVAQFATAAPAVYAAWHGSEMLFGLMRKLLIKTTTPTA